MLRYKYDPWAPYVSSYECDCRRHYYSAYKYKQKLVLDKDYEAECKPIWGHSDKNEAKLSLAQEFDCKTILAREPIQKFPLAPIPPTPILPAPASADQKFKLNPLDGQERLVLAAKDLKC